MLSRKILLFLLSVCGLTFNPAMVQAQLAVPYSPNVDSEVLAPYSSQLLQDAVQLIRFREFDLALLRAKLAAQLSPNQYETWFILGTLYVQTQESQAGVDALLRAKELAPEEAEVLFSLGNSYFQVGDYEASIREINAGLQINREVPQAFFDLGNAHLQLRQFPDAIASYQEAVELESEFWPAINNIGLAEYEQGDKESAIARWEEALTIDEQQAEPHLAIAVALYSQGSEAQAIRIAEQALILDGTYGNEEYLIRNLWGEKLMEDTRVFFTNPAMVRILERRLVPLDETS